MTFKSYIDNIFEKPAHKLNDISRTASYMDFSKRKLVVNPFFSSQFNYCCSFGCTITELIITR